MKHYLLTALVLLASAMHPTFASDKIKIIDIGMAGNGCPEETASTQKIIINQGSGSVHIISPYFVLPGPPPNRAFTRYKCDVAVSVEVANGYQIGTKASVNGFILLDDAAKSSEVKLNTFFAGDKSEPNEVKFDKPTLQNFELLSDAMQWSKCGANSILRMKASATLRAKQPSNSYLRVNSFGMELEYRTCS